MHPNYRAGVRALAAGAALALGLAATDSMAESPQVNAPLHTVPTNIPGIYAYTQPPADFDPHQATDQQLAEWGYSARPKATASPEERELWEREVRLQRITPYLAKREGRYHLPVQGLKIGGASTTHVNTIGATSGNWSGVALAQGSGAQPYSAVRGAWIVPTVKQAPGTCNGGWDYSSQWVGIDGFDNADLFQAGSAANVFCDIGEQVTEYFPWIEWLPAAETVVYANSNGALLPFAPGDYVSVTVTATNFSGGVSTTGNIRFQDYTQNWVMNLNVTAASLGGSEVIGASAEFIVERTEVDGSLATLPDYITCPWSFNWAQDLGATYHYPGSPGNSTAYNITMQDNNNLNVSYVNLFGTQGLWFYPEGSATQ